MKKLSFVSRKDGSCEIRYGKELVGTIYAHKDEMMFDVISSFFLHAEPIDSRCVLGKNYVTVKIERP